MTRQHGFGIIGAGMIGEFHAQAIEGLENARLVAACDSVEAKVTPFAAKHRCKGYTELERMLGDDEVDVLTVATPSGAHAEPAIAAARAGKHAIVEKPLDVTLDRIDRIIEAHEKAGTTLGGVFNGRFTRAAQLLKQAVVAGRFGRLTFGMAYGPWWRDQAYYDQGGWRGTVKWDGGGALMNQGIHTVDLLQWLMGPVASVRACAATLAHERIEVEDTAAAAVEFASGALGTITFATSMWPGHFRLVEIGGDRGTAAMTDEKLLFWQFAEESPDDRKIREELLELPAVSTGASSPSAGMTADAHRANFADFLEAVEQRRPPLVSGPEARKAVAIVLAIYQSAHAGRAVRVG